MHKWFAIVPLFLAGQAVLVHWASGTERPPQSPDLMRVPSAFDGWRKVIDEPIEPGVQQLLHADGLLSRTYFRPGSAVYANLFIAWFQSQRGGASQPHSPQVCLPGSGWVPEVQDQIAIETAAGKIDVNRYIVVNNGSRAAVYYWYQMGRRAIPGEWSAKLFTISSALMFRRTDTSLVRVVVQPANIDAATQFTRDAYPQLRKILPE